MRINATDPPSVARALKTEWLLTSGIGGYAMGTALGVNTRRYHGLLVAATKPPVGRVLALHSMQEQVVIGDESVDLFSQQFGDDLVLHPQGHQHLVEFRLRPNRDASWTFRIGRMKIVKTIALLQGRNGLTLRYDVENAPENCRLRLRPFTPLRDFHSMTSERSGPGSAQIHDGTLQLRRNGFDLHWFGQICDWRDDPQWWRQFAYAEDRQRGQDWHEDQWSAGFLQCRVPETRPWQLTFAISMPGPAATVPAPLDAIRDQERSLVLDRLSTAAEQFVAQRRMGENWSTTVLAGYPWFGDWGRDTMIALPGLMLCTGRLYEAEATLLTFARHLRNGLIPNLFDDYGGAAHYNTVDASLWFVHAVREWRRANGESGNPELLDACRAIVNAYRAGTDFNIRMDEDGLIIAGDESTQLTWMDAKRDNVVFTARHGKAVEINALWLNALHALGEISESEAEREMLAALRDHAAAAFRRQFWWEERQCLHDVLAPGHIGSGWEFAPDHRLRPNQIFAVSLPFSPLERTQQRAVVRAVGERLLTPFGLRTLEPNDPQYCPRFEGDMFCRDRAYHNGTVWPWLIGPYCEAVLRVERFSAESRRRVRKILEPLLSELEAPRGGCLNQIAEVYDGDEPQRAGGCPAQAWSVAEVLCILTLLDSPAKAPRRTRSKHSSLVTRRS